MRRGLAAVVLACTFIAGGVTTAPATASTTEAAPPAAAAPRCPTDRVCFWSANNFQGTRGVFFPVIPGVCKRTADRDSGWSSAYNNTRLSIRVWELAQETSDGTKCLGRNGRMRPHQAVRRFSFGVSQALGAFP
jgi:hypothetical protein